MRQQLLTLEEEGTPIRVAVIGCGRFGSMVISQLAHAPGMEASIACDLDIRRASETLARERRPRIRPVKTNDVGKANDALNKGRHVATDDSSCRDSGRGGRGRRCDGQPRHRRQACLRRHHGGQARRHGIGRGRRAGRAHTQGHGRPGRSRLYGGLRRPACHHRGAGRLGP